MATGSLLLFVDDDVVATPNLIDEHVKSHMTAERESVVIGPMTTPVDVPLTPWVEWSR